MARTPAKKVTELGRQPTHARYAGSLLAAGSVYYSSEWFQEHGLELAEP